MPIPNIICIIAPWWIIIWVIVAKYPIQGGALWGLAVGLASIGFLVKCPLSIVLWTLALISFLAGGYYLFILKHDPNLPPGHGQAFWPNDYLKKKHHWFKKR